MYKVEREYDGFKADVGETETYFEAIALVRQYGFYNTADYYAKIRVLHDGKLVDLYEFPPGAHTDYKGD